jgi:hypothetical protein
VASLIREHTSTPKPLPSSGRFSIIPGSFFADPASAMAGLQIGRACALAGDNIKAMAAYQDFLTLWKDAFPY